MSKKYSILLADLDNTLLDFTASERIAITNLLSRYGSVSDGMVDAYSAFNDSLWKRLEKGEITRSELISMRFIEFFKQQHIDGDGKLAAQLYEKYLSETAIWIDGAFELLQKCRGLVRVYIISNGTARVQLPRLQKCGIDKMTDGYFISELVGYNKPDILYFDKIRAEIPEFIPEKTLVLGDSLTADIAGGAAAGLATCLFDRNKKYKNSGNIKPDFIINKLSDIYKTLDI